MIESDQFYSGTLVLELIEAAEIEIETAVNEAYAEGYKAAMLEYVPDYAALQLTAESLRGELQKERNLNRFLKPVIGFSFVAGFLLHILVAR